MKKQLELVFLDTAGRQFIVRVDQPRDDLTSTEVQAQMQAILAAGVFQTAYGELASVVEANVVTTNVETFTYA